MVIMVWEGRLPTPENPFQPSVASRMTITKTKTIHGDLWHLVASFWQHDDMMSPWHDDMIAWWLDDLTTWWQLEFRARMSPRLLFCCTFFIVFPHWWFLLVWLVVGGDHLPMDYSGALVCLHLLRRPHCYIRTTVADEAALSKKLPQNSNSRGMC